MKLEIAAHHLLKPLHRVRPTGMQLFPQLALIPFSLAAIRLPLVFRCTVKLPVVWLTPQYCVKPKKLKVSGFPSPRFFRRSAV
jgi:hypothetical protein